MTTPHTVLWIDHHEAKVFHVTDLAGSGAEKAVTLHLRHHLTRHEATTAERAQTTDAMHFYRDVAHAVADASEILVVGPGTAKLAFNKYVDKHDHALEPKVIGLETVDHPTDGELLAYARRYFHAEDRMLGTVP